MLVSGQQNGFFTFLLTASEQLQVLWWKLIAKAIKFCQITFFRDNDANVLKYGTVYGIFFKLKVTYLCLPPIFFYGFQ